MFGKKNKYAGRDEDKDRLDDGYEVDVGRHDDHNNPRHQGKALTFSPNVYNHNGVLGIFHSGLTNNLTRANKLVLLKKMKKGKSRDVHLRVDFKAPTYDDKPMKSIKIPKAEMKSPKRFDSNFSMDYVNNHIKRMLKKRGKV